MGEPESELQNKEITYCTNNVLNKVKWKPSYREHMKMWNKTNP